MNVTGLPEPPPVAVSVAVCPTVPVAGGVKPIDWASWLTVTVNGPAVALPAALAAVTE
ncbi:hypothetical protein [Trebonia sp.]|uniref:hypothetical protein n=1 Tax=Trebonia sp. TaxID=2767075 RepID=UPI002602F53E|nr:hypothetical protein [Trebonia sp.]